MKVIVIGGGEIGFAMAKALAPAHDVVVVDHAGDVATRFEKLDVHFVLGAATSADVLSRAGVAGADALIACTALDEVNIVACAMARQMGSPRTFCFISREDFLSLEDKEGLKHLGIDRLIWPEAQLAADIERIVRATGAIDAETFADGAVQLLEYRLEPESRLPGRRVKELHLPHSTLIIAVRRGDSFFIPRGDSPLAVGDRCLLIGTPDALKEVFLRIIPDADTGRQRVTIIGGGDVGLRLAQGLEEGDPMDVTVIERDQARGEMVAARLRRALVVHGDGTDLELLESEGISRSHVLVSVIDNDERNLFASLLARQLGVRRIITRVGKQANLRLFERVGVDVPISARGAAVASVLHEVQGGPSRLLAVVEQGAARILEVDVPAGYTPRLLRELASPRDSIVAAILRNGRAIVPRGDDRIEAGDRLIVFSSEGAVHRVRDFFASAKA